VSTARTFPPSRDARENEIKTKAGYVEYIIFSEEGGGYFCGTCAAFCPNDEGKGGFCQGLKVPVKSYGCCNNWHIAPREEWVGADGEPL